MRAGPEPRPPGDGVAMSQGLSTPEPGRGRAAPAGWRWFTAAPAGETLVGARSAVQTLCGARCGCEMRVPPTHTHSPVLELARSFSGQAAHFFCFSYWVNHATLSWPSRSWWVLSTFDLSCRCCGRCRRGLAGSSHSSGRSQPATFFVLVKNCKHLRPRGSVTATRRPARRAVWLQPPVSPVLGLAREV